MQATGDIAREAEHTFDAPTLLSLLARFPVAPSALPLEDGPADLIVVTQPGGGRPAMVWQTLRQLADKLAREQGCTVAEIEILVRVRAMPSGQREESYHVRRKTCAPAGGGPVLAPG